MPTTHRRRTADRRLYFAKRHFVPAADRRPWTPPPPPPPPQQQPLPASAAVPFAVEQKEDEDVRRAADDASSLDHPADEEIPKPDSFASRAWRYLTEPVEASVFVEFELVLLTFCTGIQDAISFPDYHCFASNQTGNTVFLMLAIVLPELNGEQFITANIGAALGFFLLAGWVTGQVSHIVGPRRRGWLVVCNLLQTCLVFAAAVIQLRAGGGRFVVTEREGTTTTTTTTRQRPDPSGPAAVAVVALLAFASGSQVVQSRSLKMTEISTAMATAAWVDLMIDPGLFGLRNRPRTRRVCFLLTLAAGALVGAGVYRTVGSAPAIFLSAAGKLLVTVLYLFNRAERPDGDGKKKTAGDALV
ncbi:hypothetical protein GGR56DRAFT_686501 [Xylariaceae sp. FL0804]|nr:hypothetical protein GGR56DRAFT_686501 [Xylariaceae sp. FL0804]